MARYTSRLTIIGSRLGPSPDINEELQWIGKTLGLFTERDKEKSCFRIFIELLRSTKGHDPLTSDELALRLNLARGTVVHHLNKLLEAGLVQPHKKAYILRHELLEKVIEDMEEDTKRVFMQLKALSRVIDKKLTLH